MPIDQNTLSKLVDEKVRMTIGELTMQTIVLKTLLDMQGEVVMSPENQPQTPHTPRPNPIPQPIPADNPTPPRTQPSPPDKPESQPTPPQQAKGNGSLHPIRGA
jgi:hypothetical protein